MVAMRLTYLSLLYHMNYILGIILDYSDQSKYKLDPLSNQLFRD
jgi:hypothetical protein